VVHTFSSETPPLRLLQRQRSPWLAGQLGDRDDDGAVQVRDGQTPMWMIIATPDNSAD